MIGCKNLLFLISIILAVILSGCTSGQDVTPVVKAIPEVQQFLNEHPNARITVTYWSKDDVLRQEADISKQCDKTIAPSAMYKAIVSEGDIKSITWINADTMSVICTTIEGRGGTPVPTGAPAITPTVMPTRTPMVTSSPEITSTPEVTSTSFTPVATTISEQDTFELKNGYRLKLSSVEGMNEDRYSDGSMRISKGTDVMISIQLLRDGKAVNEQIVPEGTTFSLYDEGKIIVKASFRTIFLGTVNYMVKLENLIQYDRDTGGAILTRDIVSLVISHPV